MSRTPGPWELDDELCLYSGDRLLFRRDGASDSDANLAAAAPDLLAMCESVLPLLDGDHDGSQQYEDMRAYQAEQIRAAIKKARGE